MILKCIHCGKYFEAVGGVPVSNFKQKLFNVVEKMYIPLYWWKIRFVVYGEEVCRPCFHKLYNFPFAEEKRYK